MRPETRRRLEKVQVVLENRAVLLGLFAFQTICMLAAIYTEHYFVAVLTATAAGLDLWKLLRAKAFRRSSARSRSAR